MGWSVPIGSVKGTVIRLHFTFLLFFGWILIAAYATAGPGAALGALVFFTLLFASVVLHEFGHILTARRFGVRTPDVTLLPIGGVARLERIPEQPRQELLIALAGPAVNFVIAGLLLLILGGFPTHIDISFTDLGSNLIGHLAYINLGLGLFNLIPAFPMDGGRALRALLSARFGYAQGTRIAAQIGQGLAVALGIFALFSGHVLLAVIALFVYITAGAEAGLAQVRGATLGAIASDLMMTDFRTLTAGASVGEAAEILIRTHQRDMPIVDASGRLRGLLTREGAIKALGSDGAGAPVVGAMQAEVPAVSSFHVADEAVRHLQRGAPAVAVNDGEGRLVGLITWENLLEHLMITKARAGAAPAAVSPARSAPA